MYFDVHYVHSDEGTMATLHYDKVADVLDNFKALLDAAERGRPATLRRDKQTAALVDADRLRYFLGTTAPNANATVVAEADSWWVFTKGLSISADGATLDEALDEMVAALREYAEDWQDHSSLHQITPTTGALFNWLASAQTRSCESGLASSPTAARLSHLRIQSVSKSRVCSFTESDSPNPTLQNSPEKKRLLGLTSTGPRRHRSPVARERDIARLPEQALEFHLWESIWPPRSTYSRWWPSWSAWMSRSSGTNSGHGWP